MPGCLLFTLGPSSATHWTCCRWPLCVQGALLRAGFTGSRVHYGREAMTDITLGALQDSGWCALVDCFPYRCSATSPASTSAAKPDFHVQISALSSQPATNAPLFLPCTTSTEAIHTLRAYACSTGSGVGDCGSIHSSARSCELQRGPQGVASNRTSCSCPLISHQCSGTRVTDAVTQV